MTVFLALVCTHTEFGCQRLNLSEPMYLTNVLNKPLFLRDFCINSDTALSSAISQGCLPLLPFSIIAVFLSANTRKETSLSLFLLFHMITSHSWPGVWAAVSTCVYKCSGIEPFISASPITTVNLRLYPRGYQW